MKIESAQRLGKKCRSCNKLSYYTKTCRESKNVYRASADADLSEEEELFLYLIQESPIAQKIR